MKQLLLATTLLTGTAFAAAPAQQPSQKDIKAHKTLIECFHGLQDYLQSLVKSGALPSDYKEKGKTWLIQRPEYEQGNPSEWLTQLSTLDVRLTQKHCQHAASACVMHLFKQLNPNG